jgi:DNA-binding NarL/FixJ family response regulator
VAINLAVIEDDPMLCEEITEYFAKKEHIHCVLVVDSISRFRHFFREFMNINVVLLDINLPEMSGVDGLPAIRRLLPDAEIVMHTMVNDHDTVFKCICAGANGYLLKDGNLQNLERTLIEIEENSGCALTPSVARRILAYFQPAPRQPHPEQLSDQELKVSRLLVDGMPYQQVADVLNLSINGVRYHIKNIYRKLHITSKGELLKRYREGRIDL